MAYVLLNKGKTNLGDPMQFIKTSIFLFALCMSVNSIAGSYLNWQMDRIDFLNKGKKISIRTGFLKANPDVPFKGNILYYQGLADSMLNHDPLFEVLIKDGYRVIAFDYMGQGGSLGSMNYTKIQNINRLGDLVISKYKRNDGANHKYHIIGWSTGGLAAYKKAYLDKGKTVKSITLIAPGISPRYLVGEGLFNWPIDEITIRTLTTNRFIGVNDPHEDAIYPASPAHVLKFSINLQMQAYKARRSWKISKAVKGFVLLSDPRIDTYVNSNKTLKAIKKNARHFKTLLYKNTLHEIDNEEESTAKLVRRDILNFINNQ